MYIKEVADMNEDLASVIEKIVNNPEFAGMVSEMKGTGSATSSEDMSREMMKKLPDVMNMVSGMFGGSKNDGENKKNDIPQDAAHSAANIIPTKYDKTKAERLLCALKPYLSGGRCEIIDRCLSVMQITDIMGAVRGLEGLSGTFGKGGE